MRAIPSAAEILTVVAQYLREDLASQQVAPDRFHLLVAANAIDIARRDIELGAAADAAARTRLHSLLGDATGSLEALELRLCEAIASGALELDDAALRDHLVATALDEVAIDQPRYASAARMRAAIKQRLGTAKGEGAAT